ncbi:FHA domain-containing protein [Kitasatospora sp. NPDC097605]|uniref:FHA domain-containing protein n=1 Tax=Kitasatospora sp. NPDC097605 TaxID=3157226 RepID=UPI00332B3007
MSPPSQDQALPRLIVDGPDRVRGQAYVLDHEPLLVGRDATCGLQLVHPLLSRRHAVVWWAGGHATVEDLSSTNGTRLNGHRVLGQEILRGGDVLRFGPLEAHYEEPADAVTAVAGPDSGTRESEPEPEPATLITKERPPEPRHVGAGAPTPVPALALDESAAREKTPYGTAGDQPPAPAWPGPAAPPKPPAPPPPHRAAAPAAALPLLDVPSPNAPPNAGPSSPPPSPPPSPPSATPGAPRYGAEPRFDVDRQVAEGNLNNVGGHQYNAASHFEIDDQIAENLSNIGRDQVNYIYRDDHLEVARRETFFRKLAVLKTTSRHVLLWGLALALLGSAFLGWEGSYPDALSERIQSIAHTASIAVGLTGAVLLVGGGAVLIRTVVRQRRYERDEERRLNPRPSPSG